ncbi:MAG: two-component regulator propeller domain-containing protein [Acidobacteriota bacterium]|nr:two-component regulator propeller domain-containing protein [Acidobacteriota bacterium]
MFRSIWISLLLLPVSQQVEARERRPTRSVRFEQIRVDQRIANTKINCMLQDHLGWMWFGTDNGLLRFNGFGFKTWKNTEENPNILTEDKVLCLFEDRDGYIWIGTTNGLNRYDRRTDSFSHYRPEPQTPGGLPAAELIAVCEGADGSLWIATRGKGILVMTAVHRRAEPHSARFEHLTTDSAASKPASNWIFDLFVDKAGVLWVGTLKGLMLWKPGQELVPADITAEEMGGSNQVLAITQDRQGALWLGVKNNMVRFEPTTGRVRSIFDRFDHLKLSGPLYPSGIEEDMNGKLWVATVGNGLLLYDPKADRLTQFLPDPLNLNGIGSKWLWSMMVDRTGLLWIGTVDKGIYLHNPETSRFGHFRLAADQKEPDPGITAVHQDTDGSLWLGTNQGVFRYHRDGSLSGHFAHDPNDPSSLGYGLISSFLPDHRGLMWIATRGGGLTLIPRDGSAPVRRYLNDRQDPSSLAHDAVLSMYQDRRKRIWIGTVGGGLDLFEDGRFTHFLAGTSENSISGDTIYAITEDRDGRLWFGTDDGLCYRQKGVFQQFRHNLEDPKALNDRRVLSLCLTQRGTLWVGTYRGLNRLVEDGDRFFFERFGEKEGLPTGIEAVLEDAAGLLWISSPHGLVRFDPERKLSRTYTARDGMQSDSFIGSAAFKNSAGKLYFGGEGGFNVFDPLTIRDNPLPPRVFLTSLSIFNEPVSHRQPSSPLQEPIGLARQVSLTHRENFISLEFVALDYAVPERNRYAYKMEGLHDEWRFTSGVKNDVTYANLSPGNYVFHVKGSNRDGRWQEEARTLGVVVKPPFWATRPAYALYGMVLLLSILAYLRAAKNKLDHERQINERLDRKVAERTRDLEERNDEVLRQQRKLREMDQLKTRFFTNLSHEFRTPLTLILGPLEDLPAHADLPSQVVNTHQGIRRNALRLLQMINELLDVSKLEAGRMILHIYEMDMVAFIDHCLAQFKPLEQQGPSLSARLPDHPVTVFFDPDKMEKVVSNLVFNAFKHVPPSGRIVVTLSEEDEFVQFSVKDNGPGIDASRLPHLFDRFYQAGTGTGKFHGTGIGLALARELVELHAGQIGVSSEQDFGSEFTVRLPKGCRHFKPEQLSADIPADMPVEPPSRFDPETLRMQEPDGSPDETTEENQGRTTVLLIEDNSEMRAYLAAMLQTHYRILSAESGEDGMVRALEEIPDLIICDVMLPGISGLEVCRKLKQDEHTSHIPVIILTARAAADQTIEGLAHDADVYITKPFNSGILLSQIDNLIRNRRLLRDLYSQKITAAAADIEVLSGEAQFLKKVVVCVEENLSEPGFGVNELAEALGFSRRQLLRKIAATTGKTPSEIMRDIRLERAAHLLRNHTDQITQIAYTVGFAKPQYFAKKFREVYGKTPSEYAAEFR